MNERQELKKILEESGQEYDSSLTLTEVRELLYDIRHVGCRSYPNCDEMGCH